jgi:cytochrome c oxidase subunit 2
MNLDSTTLQNVLSPAGAHAQRIAELSWVLFVGGTVIFLVVGAFLALASFGSPGLKARLGSRGFILAGGVAFPVVVLSVLLVWTLGINRAVSLPVGGPEPLRVQVIGYQFWWEVRYPGTTPEGDVVTANEIRIPTGRDVLLEVTSADVIHSIWIPALHGKVDMIPGRWNTRAIRADRPGVLRGQCTEYCGAQHALMAFFVVAETPERFAAWLERQGQPVALPEDPVLARGAAAFGEAGCGSCHAVRGTAWNGQRGPDLTHVGSRLSLAAGVLDNHKGTLAGWIAGAQDIKPGNRMPSFAAVLDGPELRAMAAWLESLR